MSNSISMEISSKLSCNMVNTDRTEISDDDHDTEVEEVQLKPKTKSKGGRQPVQTSKTRRAPYWEYYIEFTDPEDGKRKARCKFCPNKVYVCDSNTSGTSNVKNHAELCPNNPNIEIKGTQTKLTLQNMGDGGLKMKGWSFDEKFVREYVCRMVIRDEMPFRAIERDGLVDAFYAAQPLFKMPSRSTITRDCSALYLKEREKLKQLLKTSCQSVCLTTDTWTSVANDNYTCVTAHWIDDDWKLQRRIINFMFTTCHKGVSISRTLDDCLRFWDLSRKLLTVTVDNASANNVACRYLEEISKDNGCIAGGKYLHVRCIAHILNLIVQDGLKDGGSHLDKVREMVRFCRASPSRKEAFRKHAERLNIECKSSLANDVPTRWNSTYMMLSSVMQYKPVFARMNIPEDEKLGPMTTSDWSRVEKLCHFLKEFYVLTNRISGSSYVTSNWLIYHVGVVCKMVNRLLDSDDVEMSLMGSQMKIKFDRYFGSIEKVNLLMFVPAILDPQRKIRGVTTVLKTLFPENDADFLVKTVIDVAYELFDEFRILHYPQSEGGSQSRQSVSTDREETSWIDEFVEEGTDCVDHNLRSEFDQYLVDSERPEVGKKTVLEWWSDNRNRYPVLARMARAVLAIPITTVPSESAFSTGGRTISEYRSNLSPEMVQAIVCTQDWLRGTSLKNAKARKEEEVEDCTMEEDSADNDKINLTEGTFYICD